MGEWCETTLGEVSVDGGHYGIAASAVDYSDELPTYLRITDIRDDGTVIHEGLMSVDHPDARDYLLSPNDLVIARTGASTGRNYFYDGHDGDFVYAGFLIKFSISPSKIHPPFVKHWFQSPPYKSWLNSHTDGSTRANINAVTLSECPIRYPDIDSQKKIAAVLSSLDDKIENNRKICKNLEEQAQAIFKSWFVGFEPFGGEMPKEWRLGQLSDLANVIRDSIAPGEMPDVVEHYSLPAFDKNCLPAYEKSATILSSKFRLTKGVLLISKLNPRIRRLWDPSVDSDSAVSSTEFVVLQPQDGRSRGYLYSILASDGFYEYSCANAAGTTNSHQRISPEDILNFPVCLPDDQTLMRFSSVVEPMMDKAKAAHKESGALAELRDALLPKLMSGEIDVDKVEIP